MTQGSDHPPVLEPHMVLNPPLMSALKTPTQSNKRKKRKETDKKKLQQAIESETKAKSKIT
jgi:hypothetical protein